jgi:hypothetical protein
MKFELYIYACCTLNFCLSMQPYEGLFVKTKYVPAA